MPTLNENLEQAKKDLTTLRDELKVKMHLAKMNAADAWTALEPALQKVERGLEDAASKAGDATEKVRLQAHLGLAQLKDQWPGIEQAVGQVVDDMKKAGDNVKTNVDTARVKAHLASLDANAMAEKALNNLDKLNADLERETSVAVDELRKSFQSLKKKLLG